MLQLRCAAALATERGGAPETGNLQFGVETLGHVGNAG
jgi:hypothetical protein